MMTTNKSSPSFRYGELRQRVMHVLPALNEVFPEGFTRLDVQKYLEKTYRGKILPSSISNELALQCDQGILIRRGTGIYRLNTSIRPVSEHKDVHIEQKLDALIAAVNGLAQEIRKR